MPEFATLDMKRCVTDERGLRMYPLAQWADVALAVLVPRDQEESVHIIGREYGVCDGVFRALTDWDAAMQFACEETFVFKFQIGERATECWDSTIILSNLKEVLRKQYRRIQEGDTADAKQVDALAQWVSLTRSLIGRSVPLLEGRAATAAMAAAADSVESSLNWLTTRFRKPPRGTAQRYFKTYLWTISELVRAANTFAPHAYVEESVEFGDGQSVMVAGRATMWQWKRSQFLLNMLADDIQVSGDDDWDRVCRLLVDDWKNQIDRFKDLICPGQEDALIADVLKSLRYRRYLQAEGEEDDTPAQRLAKGQK